MGEIKGFEMKKATITANPVPEAEITGNTEHYKVLWRTENA
jgi:hypothetical protein